MNIGSSAYEDRFIFPLPKFIFNQVEQVELKYLKDYDLARWNSVGKEEMSEEIFLFAHLIVPLQKRKGIHEDDEGWIDPNDETVL